jgi:excisionase family DNA binding protein
MAETSPIANLTGGGRREEAAGMLSLSVHTVARDVRLGRIQARHYGRRVLIPASEILRIAAHGMGAKPKA